MNYANGKIYKIVCNITGLVYVGSTTQALSKRLYHHKFKYKCWCDGKYPFMTSFIIIEKGGFDIVLIETCSCG